jgi:hypothetical protein
MIIIIDALIRSYFSSLVKPVSITGVSDPSSTNACLTRIASGEVCCSIVKVLVFIDAAIELMFLSTLTNYLFYEADFDLDQLTGVQLGEKLRKGLINRFMPVSLIGAASTERQIHSSFCAAIGLCTSPGSRTTKSPGW